MSTFIYRQSIFMRARSALNSIAYRLTKRWRQFCDWLKWIGHKPGGLEAYAANELRLAGMFDSDSDYNGMLGRAVLRMVREFSQEGHSGMSAGLAINLFEKVSRYTPLQPLTGEDDEWHEVGDGMFQNRRCSHVFKDADGAAYDIDGRVFREPSSRASRVYVQFPYTPTTEYVDIPDPTP